MAYDTLEIGPVPCEEECEQLGPDYDPRKARAESRRFIELIEKKFGKPPEGARLFIKGNQHDFGTYYDVAIYFDMESEEATRYAYDVEANTPRTWED